MYYKLVLHVKKKKKKFFKTLFSAETKNLKHLSSQNMCKYAYH